MNFNFGVQSDQAPVVLPTPAFFQMGLRMLSGLWKVFTSPALRAEQILAFPKVISFSEHPPQAKLLAILLPAFPQCPGTNISLIRRRVEKSLILSLQLSIVIEPTES